MTRLLLVVLLMASVGLADDATPYIGRSVAEVIDEFREQGEPFAYSTNVVSEELTVLAEPGSGTPLEIVRQILQPHGLTIRTDSGVHLVVRMEPQPAPDESAVTERPPASDQDIETVVVAASRYAISRDLSASHFSIDQRTIQNMPDVGEDPIRVTQRLPGAAASGASAAAHFRGGEQDEVGIMLNGQWLFDPFHIRDYQNIFSTVDARAIEGVEVYTGGFPVRYGDRMSGLVLMDTLEAEKPRHTEIGLSVFNTSLLIAGNDDDRNWLFSARRGNLDLVIDREYGRPSYFDVFGEYTFDISPNARLSVNALYADDEVEVVLESEPAELEQVNSDTRNAQLWLRLDSNWSSTLTSSTVLSFIDYSNRRRGSANDPEKMIARVADDRDVSQYGIRQDWTWTPSDRHRMGWGLQLAYSDAEFVYDGVADYFELQAIYEGQPESIVRNLRAAPDGGSYALYLADRWRVSDRTMLEWGLRWDDQTYTDTSSDSQLSPRFSLLWLPRESTELRFSVGRYYQSQAVQSLQIEDGITNYWPAQRADQFIVGVSQLLANDTSIRIEAFLKEIRELRPRFENLYDPLGIIPELQADRVRLDPTKGRARGIEISTDRASGDWNWWASYTWSKVTDRINGANEPRSWDQRHAFQGGFGWHNDDGWNFSMAASVHSGWPATNLSLVPDGLDEDGEPQYVAIPGPRNADQHPTFSSIDLRLSRRFDVKRGTLMAFIEVSNIFNRDNPCCRDYDLEEDEQGNALLEFSHDHWLPLLPAIGILWEF